MLLKDDIISSLISSSSLSDSDEEEDEDDELVEDEVVLDAVVLDHQVDGDDAGEEEVPSASSLDSDDETPGLYRIKIDAPSSM